MGLTVLVAEVTWTTTGVVEGATISEGVSACNVVGVLSEVVTGVGDATLVVWASCDAGSALVVACCWCFFVEVASAITPVLVWATTLVATTLFVSATVLPST